MIISLTLAISSIFLLLYSIAAIEAEETLDRSIPCAFKQPIPDQCQAISSSLAISFDGCNLIADSSEHNLKCDFTVLWEKQPEMSTLYFDTRIFGSNALFGHSSLQSVNSSTQSYSTSFTVFDGGEYQLQWQLLFTSTETALPEYPMNATSPLGCFINNKESNANMIIQIDGELIKPPLIDCSTFAGRSSGRWVQQSDPNSVSMEYLGYHWVWQSHCKRKGDMGSICKRLLLVGDSHTLAWNDYLHETHRKAYTKYVACHGMLKQDRGRLGRYWTRDPTLKTKMAAIQFQLDQSQFDVIVLNSGHWDMRDLSISEYLEDFKVTMRYMKNFMLNHSDTEFIWRTTVPYSYIHRYRDFDYTKDYRSLFGMYIAHEAVKKELNAFGIDYHDSWHIISPFWDIPCDYHHYLCPSVRPFKANGEQDILTFISSLCYNE